MFHNEEDEENQYRDLVARGHSTYAPSNEAHPAELFSAPTAAETTTASSSTAEPASITALEKRVSTVVSFSPSTSYSVHFESHDPYADTQQVNITPLLLEELESIVRATADANRESRINCHQAALASCRMKLISSTLRQMPHPAPSHRLLTALQSLCLLVRQCAYDAAEKDEVTMQNIFYGPNEDPLGPSQCWPVLLSQHFTCRLLFRNAYRRLWTAWRMYSPLKLQHEDAVAEAKDRGVNVEVMLRRLFDVQDRHALEEKLSLAKMEQYEKDMLAFYQRSEMSPWRVPYSQLEPTTWLLRVPPSSSPNPLQKNPAASPEGEKDFHFSVLPTVYLYNGVPVVIKALRTAVPRGSATETPSSFEDCDAETEAAAIERATDFLQDVACRCMWRHPHIVGCVGAYTEKFVPLKNQKTAARDSGEEDALLLKETGATAGGLQKKKTTSVLASSTTEMTAAEATKQTCMKANTPAAAAQPLVHEVDLPWSRQADTLSGTPVMALGYITELQTSAETGALCATLGDMLFPSSSNTTTPTARYYFSLPEALDICAQLADALQYILEDGGDVPEAVRTSWLTLDPFNVYVVRTVGPRSPVGKLEPHQRQKQHLSREGTATSFSDIGGPHAVRGSSDGVVLEVAKEEYTPLLHPASQHAAVHGNATQISALPATTFETVNSAYSIGTPPIVTSASPLREPQHFIVRYAPPSNWTNEAVGSRWRPHPCATAPACYVVAQLFLALMTRQVPYATYKSDSDVQRRVFDVAANRANDRLMEAEAAAAGVQVKWSSSGQGYTFPSSLPPPLVQWCRLALSLDKSQAPMELESLRDALTTIQALQPEAVWSSPAPQDVPYASSLGAMSREMSSRFGSGAV